MSNCSTSSSESNVPTKGRAAMLEFDPLCLMSAVAKKCHRNTNIGCARNFPLIIFFILSLDYSFFFLLLPVLFSSGYQQTISLAHKKSCMAWVSNSSYNCCRRRTSVQDSSPILIRSKTISNPAIHQHHKHYFDKLTLKTRD